MWELELVFSVFDSETFNFFEQKLVWLLSLCLHRMDVGWRIFFFFFLPWQPLMQHRCRRWASAAAVIIRGLEEARWNVIWALVSNNQGVLSCRVWSPPDGTGLCWKWGLCICPASPQRVVAPRMHWPPLKMLSSVSFTLFPISAYATQSL